MASQSSAVGDSSQREAGAATPTQNDAAYHSAAVQSSDLATPSSPSDSKRSNAARLARELGSSSPWSESLMPQTYGTISPQPYSTGAGLTVEQEFGNTRQFASAQAPQETDPPPAYSRTIPPTDIRPVYELPAETMNTEQTENPVTEDENEAVASPDTDLEQNQTTDEVVPTVETPLLCHHTRRQSGGTTWRWIQKGRTKTRRFGRLLCAVIFFLTVASVLMCVIMGDSGNGSSYIQPPAGTDQPLIPTGPDYRRHETVDNINGRYKLYDRLELSSSAGSIDIEIEPQPGDDPAILILSSDFNSVSLRVASDYLKRKKRVQRTIYTEIRSVTGSVEAELLLGHGGRTLVDTTTGAQNLWILASGIGPEDQVSNLTTLSKTGTQKIFLMSLDPSYKPISNLRAEHHAFGTGSVDVTYPSVWVGEVHALAAGLGQVNVGGNGLQYQRQHHDDVVASRGSAEHFEKIEVISEGTGSASFKC